VKRRTGLLILAAIAAALAAGLAWAMNVDSASTPGAEPPNGNSSLAAMKAFSKFPLYDTGDSMGGLPLTGVQSDQNPDVVTFVYGDCMLPEGEGGCAPPVSIQIWNACNRNPTSYTQDMLSPIGDKTAIRGVPAAYFEGGNRLEIQTGRSTVVIFADSPAPVARALRGVNNSVSADVDLPAPAQGAMNGTLKC
jgi:hypothetical protein